MPVGAITPIAAGSLAATAASATLSVVAPAFTSGNLMVAAIMSKDNLTWTVPAGWTSLGQHNNTANQTCLVAYKETTVAESGASFNFVKSSNNSVLSCGVIEVWNNARVDATINPSGISWKDNASGDNVVFNDYTTGRAPSRVVWIGFYNLSATNFGTATFSGTSVDVGPLVVYDLETATGTTASIAMAMGRSLSQSTTGALTWASNSTVDAISTGAVFAMNEGTPALGGTSGGSGSVGGPGLRERRRTK